MFAAECEDVVDIGFFAENFMCVGFVGAAKHHQIMFAAVAHRHSDIAVHFAGLEIPYVEAGFTVHFIASFRALVNRVDHTEAAVATEIQALTTAENFYIFDHARIKCRRAPQTFERRATVKCRYTVKQQQSVTVGTAVDTNRKLAFIRGITDIGTTN